MSLAALTGVVVVGAALLAGRDPGSVDPASGCPASQVRHDSYRGGDHRTDRIPWLRGRPAGSGLAVLLAYWPQEWTRSRRRGATTYTGGEMPQGWSTKTLWTFVGRAQKDRGGRELLLKGTRLDAHGTFTQRFAAISFEGQAGAPSYASTVDVPKAGCWRLDVSTAKLRASVVVRAFTAPGRR
jgi:hypothetical protein